MFVVTLPSDHKYTRVPQRCRRGLGRPYRDFWIGDIGVDGFSPHHAVGGIGVQGMAFGEGGIGVYAEAGNHRGTALYADNTNESGYAGVFRGRVRLAGEASFEQPPTISPRFGAKGWENAGIWYADNYDHDSRRQFVGVKVHSDIGTDQQFGIWQDGAWKFWFRGNNQAYKFGSNTWSAASDARDERMQRENRELREELNALKRAVYARK